MGTGSWIRVMESPWDILGKLTGSWINWYLYVHNWKVLISHVSWYSARHFFQIYFNLCASQCVFHIVEMFWLDVVTYTMFSIAFISIIMQCVIIRLYHLKIVMFLWGTHFIQMFLLRIWLFKCQWPYQRSNRWQLISGARCTSLQGTDGWISER